MNKGLEDCLKQSPREGTQSIRLTIERLNGTVRERLASLTRKCRHASRRLESISMGYVPDWLHLQPCLGRIIQLGQTPAQAAELTDHVWSLQEVLTYKVPPDVLPKPRKPNTVFSSAS